MHIFILKAAEVGMSHVPKEMIYPNSWKNLFQHWCARQTDGDGGAKESRMV